MVTEEQIQARIDEAKKHLNAAITLAVKYGEQKSGNRTSQDCGVWLTDRNQLQDGRYVGVLPGGGYVFISVTNGKLYPAEYCKGLVKWCKLPD